MSAFGLSGLYWRGFGCACMPHGQVFGNGLQDLATMAEADADLLQILIGEVGKNLHVYCVFGKVVRVLPEAKILQPGCDGFGHFWLAGEVATSDCVWPAWVCREFRAASGTVKNSARRRKEPWGAGTRQVDN